ncbi:MAG: VWA domain-containing protein [Acidobacteria bacterium]|nr:VWA domain-containing protein [Acidobacteriota bacterium]
MPTIRAQARLIIASLAVAAALLNTPAAAGQDEGDTVTVNTRLVSLTVQLPKSAGSEKGHDLLGRLRVTADGAPHPIAFASADAPSSVALLVDASTSMRGRKYERTRDAVGELISEADPRTRYTLITFNLTTKLHGEFGGDREGRRALLNSLKGIRPDGETALYDACLDARRVLTSMRSAGGRRALVVFTDGLDTKSKATLAQLNEGLDALGGLVYVVVLSSHVASWELVARAPEDPVLDEISAGLSAATQGQVFPARSATALHQTAGKVARRLDATAQIGFYPLAAAAGKGTHRLAVTQPDNTALHARKHYFID